MLQIYFQLGEPRRCLATIEQRDLVSAEVIGELFQLLSNNAHIGLEKDSFANKFYAVILAGQCLFSLQQYDDCVSLLNPLLSDSHIKYANGPGSTLLNAARTVGLLQVNPLACALATIDTEG